MDRESGHEHPWATGGPVVMKLRAVPRRATISALAFIALAAGALAPAGDAASTNRTPASVLPVPGAPPGSCAANPQADGCPTVSEIIVTPASTDGSVGLVPTSATAARARTRS